MFKTHQNSNLRLDFTMGVVHNNQTAQLIELPHVAALPLFFKYQTAELPLLCRYMSSSSRQQPPLASKNGSCPQAPCSPAKSIAMFFAFFATHLRFCDTWRMQRANELNSSTRGSRPEQHGPVMYAFSTPDALC